MVSSIENVHGQFYRSGEGAEAFGVAAGGSDDWSHLDGTDIVFTVELRDRGHHGFALPESQIQATCEENIEGLRDVYEHVRPRGGACTIQRCGAILSGSDQGSE